MKTSTLIALGLGGLTLGAIALAGARSTTSGTRPKKATIVPLDPGATGDPKNVGRVCQMVGGTYSALDSSGACVPFWDNGTATAIESALLERYEELGRPAALCVPTEQYVDGLRQYVYKPAARQLVYDALTEVYGGTWPAPVSAQEWVDVAQQLAFAVFAEKVCGLPVPQ